MRRKKQTKRKTIRLSKPQCKQLQQKQMEMERLQIKFARKQAELNDMIADMLAPYGLDFKTTGINVKTGELTKLKSPPMPKVPKQEEKSTDDKK